MLNFYWTLIALRTRNCANDETIDKGRIARKIVFVSMLASIGLSNGNSMRFNNNEISFNLD